MSLPDRSLIPFDRTTAAIGALYMAVGLWSFWLSGQILLALAGAATVILSSGGLWWRRRTLGRTPPLPSDDGHRPLT